MNDATESGSGNAHKNFIEVEIEKDLATKPELSGRTVYTRFPPEPNGYLHIGHAKSICLNFGLAKTYGGHCNLRFDDTNPTKESEEYVNSIKTDVNWLGFQWDKLHFASDYFGQLHEWACQLVNEGKAFVCDLNADQMREYRGTLTQPGRNSPLRDRSSPPQKKTRDPDIDIVELVKRAVKTVAQERAKLLDLDTNIVVDLGLDSLERLQIAHVLESSVGGRFPEEVIQEIETVREISEAIEKHFGKERIRPDIVAERQDRESGLVKREVAPEDYRFDLMPEYCRLKQTMGQFEMTGLPNPYFSVHQGLTRDTTMVDGKQLISFASYNYIGMSGEPRVSEAAKNAIENYGNDDVMGLAKVFTGWSWAAPDTTDARTRVSHAARNNAIVAPYEKPTTPIRAGSASACSSSRSMAHERSCKFAVSGFRPAATAATRFASQRYLSSGAASARSPKQRRSGAKTRYPASTS